MAFTDGRQPAERVQTLLPRRMRLRLYNTAPPDRRKQCCERVDNSACGLQMDAAVIAAAT